MKIAELVPEIIGQECYIRDRESEGDYIILDFVKNLNDKNNIKLYNPLNHDIFWISFNIVILKNPIINTNEGE